MTDVGDNAGVDVARPGAHHEPGERREAHAGVPAAPLPGHCSSQTAAGPEVAGDQPGPSSQHFSSLPDNVAVTGPVKPVSRHQSREVCSEKVQWTTNFLTWCSLYQARGTAYMKASGAISLWKPVSNTEACLLSGNLKHHHSAFVSVPAESSPPCSREVDHIGLDWVV